MLLQLSEATSTASQAALPAVSRCARINEPRYYECFEPGATRPRAFTEAITASRTENSGGGLLLSATSGLMRAGDAITVAGTTTVVIRQEDNNLGHGLLSDTYFQQQFRDQPIEFAQCRFRAVGAGRGTFAELPTKMLGVDDEGWRYRITDRKTWATWTERAGR